MGLILTTLVVAGVLARLLGGRLTGLEALPVRGWPLLAGLLGGLWVGAAARLAGLPAAVHWLGLASAAGCALAYCLRIRAVHGMWLVAAGLVANALVVGLNGGVPLSAVAASRPGWTTPSRSATCGTYRPTQAPCCPGWATRSRCRCRYAQRWSASAMCWWLPGWPSCWRPQCCSVRPQPAHAGTASHRWPLPVTYPPPYPLTPPPAPPMNKARLLLQAYLDGHLCQPDPDPLAQ